MKVLMMIWLIFTPCFAKLYEGPGRQMSEREYEGPGGRKTPGMLRTIYDLQAPHLKVREGSRPMRAKLVGDAGGRKTPGMIRATLDLQACDYADPSMPSRSMLGRCEQYERASRLVEPRCANGISTCPAAPTACHLGACRGKGQG